MRRTSLILTVNTTAKSVTDNVCFFFLIRKYNHISYCNIKRRMYFDHMQEQEQQKRTFLKYLNIRIVL